MRLEQLHQIVEIERHKSISKAARAMFMGQPSLSGSLNNLESEIGVRIFERTNSGVSPTMEGKEIIQLARQVLEGCNQILNYGYQMHDLQGTVDLYVVPAFGFLYSEILLAFKNQFPKAALNFQVFNSEKIVKIISQGNGNIGLIMYGCIKQQKIEDLNKSGLQIHTFQSEKMVLFVSKYHPLSEYDSVSLEQIRNEKFIAYAEDHWNSINRLIQAETEPLIMLDRDIIMQLINSNKGIAVLPEKFAVNNLYCDNGMIKTVSIKGGENFSPAIECLIYPSERYLTLLEKKTLEVIYEVLKNV